MLADQRIRYWAYAGRNQLSTCLNQLFEPEDLRERSGDVGRRSFAPRCSYEKGENQEAIHRVEENARPVVPARIEPEEFDIQHVREPCHRMPIDLLRIRQSPTEIFACESSQDMFLPRDVGGVIPLNKWEVECLRVNCESVDQ